MAAWKSLPKGFVLGKPIQPESYKESVIHRLEKKQRLIITRKRDGWKIYVLFTNKGIKFYTAGCNEIADSRLDHTKAELERIHSQIADLLMLVVEATVALEGKDDITKAESVFNCNEAASLAKQEKDGKIKLTIFGALFQEGKMAFAEPYELFLLRMSRAMAATPHKRKYVSCVEVVDVPFKKAKKLVLKNNWEGLVLYNADFENNFRLDGKNPTRPSGCYKWKPEFEDDFIVREVILDSKDNTRAKEVVLLQIDPITGKEFSCGKFGKFTVPARNELAQRKRFPVVIQVSFESRFSKTGKLRNAKKLLRIRTDKNWQDCIASQSYGVV
ncbi:MAG: hypothetical protein HYT27_02470 [Parcubacteria group bacterium]|nr:hypothetical protein [Parcubacteria group bacterium]